RRRLLQRRPGRGRRLPAVTGPARLGRRRRPPPASHLPGGDGPGQPAADRGGAPARAGHRPAGGDPHGPAHAGPARRPRTHQGPVPPPAGRQRLPGRAGRPHRLPGRPERHRGRPRRLSGYARPMNRAWGAVGSAVFFALAPGVVAGVVPWWLTGWEASDLPGWWLPLRVAGVVLVVAGAG